MSDLNFYIDNAESDEVVALLQAQYRDAQSLNTIRCVCGLNRSLVMAFRCLYCGLWFCFPCAEDHFGESFKNRLKKRKENRS